MSPIERKSIRIENNQIIADGNELDSGREFEFVCDLWSLPISDQRIWRTLNEEKRVLIDGIIHIIGPSVFDAKGMSGKNNNGVSISKRQGIGFKPVERTPGVWKEVKSVKNR